MCGRGARSSVFGMERTRRATVRELLAAMPRRIVRADDPRALLQTAATMRAVDEDEALPLAFARVRDEPLGRRLRAA